MILSATGRSWRGHAGTCSSESGHARGEHLISSVRDRHHAGSSPRPWGTPIRNRTASIKHRFIPTPVGNTGHKQVRPRDTPVHPHARGEHRSTAARSHLTVGSSPRPWGTPHRRVPRRARRRFIPTPVGNTSRRACGSSTTPVHPHARGEHATRCASSVTASGSSPRPWGTLQAARAVNRELRFIPTPVGNTGSRRRSLRR